MLEINKIYNEDCIVTMEKMSENDIYANIILTSPPYNTGRHADNHKDNRMRNYEQRYLDYEETKTIDEYNDWMVDIFNHYNTVLAKDGVILFNISYGNENPNQLWLTIAEIIKRTGFMVADVICWKKSNALPNNVSPNKLTRICEFVFVFCREYEYDTYISNKSISSVSKTGQKYYNSIYNIIEAKNNDGSNKLNKATFSEDFVTSLLTMYCPPPSKIGRKLLIYDSFMGTGTTAVGCTMYGVNYIGSEISKDQIDLAEKRLVGYSLTDINKDIHKGNKKLF